MKGRPLRFLATAAIGWTALRVVMLWPAGEGPVAGIPPIAIRDFPLIIPAARAFSPPPWHGVPAVPVPASQPSAMMPPRRAPDPRRIALAMVGMMSMGSPRYLDEGQPQPVTPQFIPPVAGRLPAPARTGNRWSASAWLLLRDGGGAPAGLGSGQLGGGQAGLRIAFAIDKARRLSLVGRIVGPTAGKGREASIGFEWQPTRLPVRIVAERRFALDGGKGGPAIGLVGGTGPAPVTPGVDLETYGQAGVIRRDRTEPFADGAARLTRRAARFGKGRLDLGIGAWGGAQRDAQRLDLGPTLGLRVPVGSKSLRVSLDWRQRVAGGARPPSGPALSIGSDF